MPIYPQGSCSTFRIKQYNIVDDEPEFEWEEDKILILLDDDKFQLQLSLPSSFKTFPDAKFTYDLIRKRVMISDKIGLNPGEFFEMTDFELLRYEGRDHGVFVGYLSYFINYEVTNRFKLVGSLPLIRHELSFDVIPEHKTYSPRN